MIQIFEVGGCVRDAIYNQIHGTDIQSKDVDFTVLADSYDAMRQYLVDQGFNIWLENPEFVTIRAGVPKHLPLYERTHDADFVLARKDGKYTDGRRPDSVEAGTLLDDLARRDFKCNAIAVNVVDGTVHDPFNGYEDIARRELNFVGNPRERIEEDGLRVLRAYRFAVTKGFSLSEPTRMALRSSVAIEKLACVSVDRIRDELEKMLQFNTLATMDVLYYDMHPGLLPVIFRDGLRLSATQKR